MTQVFDDANRMIPVTVIEAGPCPVTQVKSTEKDGYDAIQIGFRQQKEHRLTKAALGHFKKAGVAPVAELSEFRTNGDTELNLGDVLTVERFEAGQKNRCGCNIQGTWFPRCCEALRFCWWSCLSRFHVPPSWWFLWYVSVARPRHQG